MDDIKIYEIDADYINYLVSNEPHIFHNSKEGQLNKRKYIGVVLHINDFDYFAPLSSHKAKHDNMKETLDFIKVKDYAVINLNNMFPVPIDKCYFVDFKNIEDVKYRSLLLSEYRFIKKVQNKIRKNAEAVYKHKLRYENGTTLARRCNDFALLESACVKYK